MQTVWSPEAEETFDSIISFIIDNWGISASNKFIRKTKKLLVSIALMPEMFPETTFSNVRKAVITSQSSVFYEVREEEIWLLYFWDNRQEKL
ncbi:MAG: type II toxin-antitoxin system RelE/ParE family toxin [Pedobacter sp.]|jgi:plasmid stabilization system protein ParE